MTTPTFRSFINKQAVVLEDSSGVPTTYYLHELSGAGRREYLALLRECSEVVPAGDGKVTTVIRDVSKLSLKLVTLSLFNESGKPVGAEFVEKLPAETLSGLDDLIKDLSGMTAKSREEIKNA